MTPHTCRRILILSSLDPLLGMSVIRVVLPNNLIFFGSPASTAFCSASRPTAVALTTSSYLILLHSTSSYFVLVHSTSFYFTTLLLPSFYPIYLNIPPQYLHLAHLVGACYILQLSSASAHHQMFFCPPQSLPRLKRETGYQPGPSHS